MPPCEPQHKVRHFILQLCPAPAHGFIREAFALLPIKHLGPQIPPQNLIKGAPSLTITGAAHLRRSVDNELPIDDHPTLELPVCRVVLDWPVAKGGQAGTSVICTFPEIG